MTKLSISKVDAIIKYAKMISKSYKFEYMIRVFGSTLIENHIDSFHINTDEKFDENLERFQKHLGVDDIVYIDTDHSELLELKELLIAAFNSKCVVEIGVCPLSFCEILYLQLNGCVIGIAEDAGAVGLFMRRHNSLSVYSDLRKILLNPDWSMYA